MNGISSRARDVTEYMSSRISVNMTTFQIQDFHQASKASSVRTINNRD